MSLAPLVFALGCGNQSANIRDVGTVNNETAFAKLQAELRSEFKATLEAAVAKVEANAQLQDTSQKTLATSQPVSAGRDANAEVNAPDSKLSGIGNVALTVAGGGTGGALVIGLVLRYIRKVRQIELKRHEISEKEQTRRLEINGKTSVALAQHNHEEPKRGRDPPDEDGVD